MLCHSCSKLVLLPTNKSCRKCQNIIYNNLVILCDNCSTINKQCSICLKTILPVNRHKGCGCGK